MTPRVTTVKALEAYRVEVTFDDGLRAEIDLKDRLSNKPGLFQELKDAEYFRQVRVDAELQTIVWPNGIDICPDVLYSLASGRPIEQVDRVSA